MSDLEELIYKYALFNASQHDGKPNTGSIMGKLISEMPQVKNKTKEVMEKIKEIAKKVERISVAEQKKIIEEKYPKLLEKKKQEIRVLKKLENTENLVMRFAPNPNGPLSLGHSRTLLLNWFYVQEYNGKLILRFDDTDPKNKIPMREAYDWIEEDVNWLGINPEKIVKAAEKLDIYYEYARKLIEMDKAYVCDCNPDVWRDLIKQKKACKCRNLPSKEQIKRWKNMFTVYNEGDAILRIKTDINHKNPAVRDWPAFRIVDKPMHPYKKAKVWPLYNFASAIDDHEFKITHIIRGVDLDVAEVRQKFIYDYFNWKYPQSILNGKLIVKGIKSTSIAKKMIESGELVGWDDPRLGTLQSLRRRGFTKDAIIEFIKELGLKKSDVEVSLENLAAINRKILDMKADRYHFVADPHELKLKLPTDSVEMKYHPEKKETREIKVTGSLYISKKDFEKYKDQTVRLKDLATVKLGENPVIVDDIDHKNLQKIQWVTESVPTDVVMEDSKIISGLGEVDLAKLKKGDIIQLVRVGFGRIDSVSPDKIVIYYSHN